MHDELKTSIVNAQTIPELLQAACEHWPDNELAVFDGERITYRQIEQRSAVVARRLLAAGVSKRSHVAILLPNGANFIVSFLAIARIGAVVVPVSTFSTSSELLHILHHADIHTLLMAPNYLKHNYYETVGEALPSLAPQAQQLLPEAPFLRRIFSFDDNAPPPWAKDIEDNKLAIAPQNILESVESEVHNSDVAAIVYTSGSTSAPKGIVHSQYTLLRQSIKQAHEKNYTNSDRIFSSMPFFWVGGLTYTLLAAMQAGATILGCKSTVARDMLDFIEGESATWFLGWQHAGATLEQEPSFPGRNLQLRGGYIFAALPKAQRPSSPDAICNGLGMTETAGPHSAGHLQPLPEHLHGSFGWASEGMEYRVVDLDSREDLPDGQEGELLLRGDTLMLGMYKCLPDTVFCEDGWYATRDMVIRRDGHIFFQGRCDDVLKIRGANISPKEVEGALCTIAGVTQSFVTGVSDGVNQYLGAVLITAPGASLKLDAIPGQLRGQLSAYKVPSVYAELAADKVPFRSSGKIDRQALIKLLEQELTRTR